MADLPQLETGLFMAGDDHTHLLRGIVFGEVTHPEWPHCWVVLLNEPGWFDTAAAVGSTILLNQTQWVRLL